jgi:hypothetical protein
MLGRHLGSWFLLAAGLTMVAVVVLVPAWRDVQRAQFEQSQLQAGVQWTVGQVDAARDMVRALDAGDEQLQQRLVAWQLNLLPDGVTPMAKVNHQHGILGWIEDTVPPPPSPPMAAPVTTLERLVSGPMRLWGLAGGVLCIFVGVVGTGPARTLAMNRQASSEKCRGTSAPSSGEAISTT